MNSKLLSLGSFTILLSIESSSLAETTTEPVGFIRIQAKTQSDQTMSFPLHRNPVLETPVISVSGNSLTLEASLAADQLVYAATSQTNHYYVRIKSTMDPASMVVGAWFSVTANTASNGSPLVSTLALDPDSTQTVSERGLAPGDVIQVIPFWTLSTLYPGGAGITPTSDLDDTKDLVLFMHQDTVGVNHAASQVNFYNTSPDLPVGWHNLATYETSGDLPIPPDTYTIVRNKGPQKTLVLSGKVPLSPQSTAVGRLAAGVPQDNLVSNPFPVSISMSESRLFELGAVTPTSNIDSPQDLVFVYIGTESGWGIRPTKTLFYCTDPQLGVGWYNLGTFEGPLDQQKVIPAGHGLIIRKKTGPLQSNIWTVNPPY